MRITESQLRSIIRETVVSASKKYLEGPEAAMERTQSALVTKLIELLPSLGSDSHIAIIEDSMNEAGVSDPAQRSMILGSLRMVPPKVMILQTPRSQRTNTR